MNNNTEDSINSTEDSINSTKVNNDINWLQYTIKEGTEEEYKFIYGLVSINFLPENIKNKIDKKYESTYISKNLYDKLDKFDTIASIEMKNIKNDINLYVTVDEANKLKSIIES
jgi:hypothetical protein